MAEYLPPTETLPVFNEFVFEDAYSIEGLDRRVVHKAGTETITGVKTFTALPVTSIVPTADTQLTNKLYVDNAISGGLSGYVTIGTPQTITGTKSFTGDFGINNANTIITSSVQIFISSLAVFLNGIQNRMASTLSIASTSIGNQIDCQGGYNYITSATTSTTANLIEATGGGSNAMSATGAGGNALRAFGSGNNTLIASTGSNELTSGKTSGTANLLDALSGGDNLIRTTTGTNTISSVNTTATANLIEATGTGGGNTMRATGSGGGGNNISTFSGTNDIVGARASGDANTIRAPSGGNNAITSTTGTNTITSTTGNNTITSTTGQIKLETGALTNTGILIENTNTTTGGITLKTNGSSGDIILSSVDNINITTSGSAGDILITSQTADVEISCGAVGDAIRLINGTTTKMTITSSAINVASLISTEGYFTGVSGAFTSPLVSFAITLYPTDYNTTSSQLSLGYPDANTANVNRVVRFPYRMRCVGWSVSGDGDAHSAVSLQLKITNQSGGAGGSIYYNQTGVLAANALQSSAAVCDLNGAVSGFSSANAATVNDITAGNNAFCWESTGGTNMNNEMLFVLFFQQVI
jgi:hypothetical protein